MPQTEEERIARRKERDAFLDALEEEERLEQARQREEENETEFMRAVRKAREMVAEIRMEQNTNANTDSNRRKKPHTRQQQSDESEEDEISTKTAPNKKGNLPKKTVSFATIPPEDPRSEQTETPQWGDVQQGRLRNIPGIKSGSDIMKLTIVERHPSTSKSLSPSASKDSDDEEEKEDEESEPEVEQDSEDEEIDIDEAMHHREIALRYHDLRQTLGTGPHGGALGGPTENSDEWDQEVSPLDDIVYLRC
jgi:hypothetical protein